MVEVALALVRDGALICALVALAVVDVRRGLLPNVIVLPAGIVGLVLAMASDPERWWAYPSSAVGVGLGLFVLAAAYPGGMGMGDVKMGGMMGAFLGPHAFVAVFLGAVFGSVVGGALVLSGRMGRRTPMPFGSFMAIGGLVVLVFGPGIYGWHYG